VGVSSHNLIPSKRVLRLTLISVGVRRTIASGINYRNKVILSVCWMGIVGCFGLCWIGLDLRLTGHDGVEGRQGLCAAFNQRQAPNLPCERRQASVRPVRAGIGGYFGRWRMRGEGER